MIRNTVRRQSRRWRPLLDFATESILRIAVFAVRLFIYRDRNLGRCAAAIIPQGQPATKHCFRLIDHPAVHGYNGRCEYRLAQVGRGSFPADRRPFCRDFLTQQMLRP
jgi:hypothetical protein